MSNMSYCRMENTYSDLFDCYETWEDTESESELKCREKILKLCKKIIDAYEEDEEDEE